MSIKRGLKLFATRVVPTLLFAYVGYICLQNARGICQEHGWGREGRYMTRAEIEDIVVREMISWDLPPDRLKIKTGSFNPSDISAEEVAAFRKSNPELFNAYLISENLVTPNLFNKIYLAITGWTLVPTRYSKSKNPDKRAPSAIFVVHNCGASHLFH